MEKGIKWYLSAYNSAAFCFWATYLVSFAMAGFKLWPANLIVLNIAQGLAILEIVHTAVKWVKSPVLSTAAQVFSRILVLVLLNYLLNYSFYDLHWGILLISIAWGITELVRYSFYLLSLYDRQPSWLLWMRYSFFIILYPIGVTGEWLIILTPLIKTHFQLVWYDIAAALLAIAYVYYFPVLYGYMWKQRKVKLTSQ